MKPTRPPILLASAVGCAAATWALLLAIYNYLPPLTWTGVPALLIAAALEAYAGRDLKARITGGGDYRPPPPILVARIVVLAKASAYAAAVVAGVCLGFVGYLIRLLQAPTPRTDMLTAGLTFGSALALLAAALYLENCCRIPKDPDREEERVPPPPPESPFPSH